jgi:O-antigen/teichoic acid export membrane protein
MGGRALLVLAFGVVANVLLARLLVPRDFGLVALGTVVLVFGGYLTEGGLGAALIRGAQPPTRRQLAAVNGLQFAATLAVAALVAAAAVPFGTDGLVVATMVASLPIAILKAPSIVALDRRLEYRVIATVDIVEALVFYGWALATVALGMGVWGMATGAVVRALVGTALMARLGPVGLVRPRWDWPAVRPMVSFGAKVQAATAVAMLRDQGLNVAVAAVAGVATLGVWNLAWRVLQVPGTLFAVVQRVSYPALARLVSAGEDPRAALEQGSAVVAVAGALVLVGLTGFAPALPAVLGPGWDDVPPTLLWSSLALLIGAPLTFVGMSYLFAVDAGGAVVRITISQAAVWFAVTLALVSPLGAPAVGVGWAAGAVVSATGYARATRRHSGARIPRRLVPPALLALLGGGAGWTVASASDADVLRGVAGALLAEAVLVGGLAAVRPSLLRITFGLFRRAARSS